ncbi:BlaI/MecI/CopY family transcriptional regulator [Actinomycetaceae bacterium MB13-C1-2]|nr:BlaI/MecI/CopY family transcriptional regulator [Actinomycetaceae bacterium MB13-C1-2]
MELLPDAELEVMNVLWDSPGSTMTSREVVNALSDSHVWKIQTVSTFLTRLCERGFVSKTRTGREINYAAIVDRGEYMSAEARSFASKHAGFSLKGLVAAFADQGTVSERDIHELSAWIEARRTEDD